MFLNAKHSTYGTQLPTAHCYQRFEITSEMEQVKYRHTDMYTCLGGPGSKCGVRSGRPSRKTTLSGELTTGMGVTMRGLMA